MSGLPDTQVAILRRQAEQLLPDTCTVKRDANDGGRTTAGNKSAANFTDHLTDVPCRIGPAGGGGGNSSPEGHRGVFAGKVLDIATAVASLPAGTDVEGGDRIVSSAGRTFDVVAVAEGSSWEVLRRAALVEVG